MKFILLTLIFIISGCSQKTHLENKRNIFVVNPPKIIDPSGYIRIEDYIMESMHDDGLTIAEPKAHHTEPLLGDDYVTSNVSNPTLLIVEPYSTIKVRVPSFFQKDGFIAEFQISYLDGYGSEFEIATEEETLAEMSLYGYEDPDQTYTVQLDMKGAAHFYIRNTGEEDLMINNYMLYLPLEQISDMGIYLADISEESSRVNMDESDIDTDELDSEESSPLPDNLLNGGHIQVSLKDLTQHAKNPRIELNFGRGYDDSCNVHINDMNENTIAHYYSDYDSDEDMGQSFIADITEIKDDDYFVIDIDNDCYVNPYIKITDANVIFPNFVMIDITPSSAAYIEHSGRFTWQTENIEDDNIGYDAPHWFASPYYYSNQYVCGYSCSPPPYDEEEDDTFLKFKLPEEVANFNNPIMEILHFAPDSDDSLIFGLFNDKDEMFTEIYFSDWEDDMGGVIKNQIPLHENKSSSYIGIGVGSEGQMALPSVIKIFDTADVQTEYEEMPK